jgi:hypothetical protein
MGIEGSGSLGDLIVKITTDLTNFNSGLKEAEKKFNDTAGKLHQATMQVATVTAAAGAAIVGAFTLMVKASTEYSEQIDEVSHRTGIATETLSQLKYAAEQSQSSFQSVAMGLRFLNKNLYEASMGNTELRNKFDALGISLKDADGNMVQADIVLMQIADRFSVMTDNTAKGALAVEIFGRSGQGLIPLLNQGSERIKQLGEEAAKLGIVLTEKNAKSFHEFSNQLNNLKQATIGLWMNISLQVLPAIESFIKKAVDLTAGLRRWSEAHPALSKGITETSLALGIFMAVMGGAVLVTAAFVRSFATLGPFMIALAPVLQVMAVALAGLSLGNILKELPAVQGFFDRLIVTWRSFLSLFQKKEETAPLLPYTVDLEKIKVTRPAEDEGLAVSALEKHTTKLKELNDLYVNGKISAQDYFKEIKTLSEDNIEYNQKTLETLQQMIDLNNFAGDDRLQALSVYSELANAQQAYYQEEARLKNQAMVDTANLYQQMTAITQTMQSMHHTMWASIFEFVNQGIQKFSAGMTTAISSIIMGTKSTHQAFKDLWKSMLDYMVNFFVELAVQSLLYAALSKVINMAVSMQASALAAAWMPAAILASIATFGGAAAAGTASVAASLGAGAGMLTAYKAANILSEGANAGMQAGYGGAMASGGEGLVDKPTWFLAGESGPERYKFTPVGNNSESNEVKTINIVIEKPVINSSIDITELAEQLGSDIERKLRQS